MIARRVSLFLMTFALIVLEAKTAVATKAFIDVTVVPMDRDRVLPHQTLIVEGDRIAAWGPVVDVTVPMGADRITGQGKFLFPGLVDMHVHVDDPSDFVLYLANGITTVRNMQGEPYHLIWRREIAAGKMLGPTLLTTGPFTNQPRIQTAEDARRAVREQKADGYDEVKVHGTLTREAYDALTATAQEVGMRVVGHAPRNLPFSAVLENGQAELAHVEELIYTYFHYDVSDAAAAEIPAVVAEIRRAGLTITPTLVTYDRIVRQIADLENLLAEPATKYVKPYELATWQRENNRYLRDAGPRRLETVRARFRFQQRLVVALYNAGVRLMLGTDAVGPTWIPGFAAHEELKNFVGLGMTNYEALATATRNPAFYWHQPREFGVVAVGARADLLLLDANPLEDVRNAQRIAGVMVRGQWLPKEDLDRRLGAIARANEEERAHVATIIAGGVEATAEYRCTHTAEPLEVDAQKLLDLYVVDAVAHSMDQKGLDATRAMIAAARARCPATVLLSEPKINAAAHRLLAAGKLAEAIRVLEFNEASFPQSFLAPFWLGEAYLTAGDTARAIAAFQRSVAIDPAMEDAKERLRKLGAMK